MHPFVSVSTVYPELTEVVPFSNRVYGIDFFSSLPFPTARCCSFFFLQKRKNQRKFKAKAIAPLLLPKPTHRKGTFFTLPALRAAAKVTRAAGKYLQRCIPLLFSYSTKSLELPRNKAPHSPSYEGRSRAESYSLLFLNLKDWCCASFRLPLPAGMI